MQYTKKTLKNGMRIITVPVKGNPTVTVMSFVETGSNYEPKKLNGISHFLEHMFFKGTENRNYQQIAEEFDNIGAINNAFTGDEYTAYWGKAHHKHTDKLIDLISDMYLNSTLPKEEIEKERGVIIEEINMYEDLPQRKISYVLWELMYGDQSAGRSVLGTKENIKKFKRSDFLNYRKKHYVADKTTIVVAGKIDEKEVQKKITKAFKDLPVSKRVVKEKVKEKQKGSQVKIDKKKTDQVHFALGFRALPADHKDLPKAELLAALLGKGMSSRLFKKMRDELGMCYYVGADHDASTDHGIFVIYAGVAKNRFKEATDTIVEILKDVKENPVSKEELVKAKESLLGKMSLSLESSDSWAQFYVFQEILSGEMKTLKDVSKEIKAVTAQDIQDMAQGLFVQDKANLAAIGDVRKNDSLERL